MSDNPPQRNEALPEPHALLKVGSMRSHFERRREGRGVWKWDHYLEAYDRHLSRFRGSDGVLLEIGIQSGGSLELWREYFGSPLRIYGVDLDRSTKRFEADGTSVFIGDQSDRIFWEEFRRQVVHVDIVIDDGSHVPEHQKLTIEELFPMVRPGGVYICEDVHGSENDFGQYACQLVRRLNASSGMVEDPCNNDRSIVCKTSEWQATVDSITFYPFMVVIEKRQASLAELRAIKKGSVWNASGD